jgi:uncharacterized protein YaiI (UPF0178 family)
MVHMKDAWTLSKELRAEALRLYGEAHRHQEIAMMLDGTHFSVPEGARATEAERRARMTPEERERFDELERRWEQRQKRLRGES